VVERRREPPTTQAGLSQLGAPATPAPKPNRVSSGTSMYPCVSGRGQRYLYRRMKSVHHMATNLGCRTTIRDGVDSAWWEPYWEHKKDEITKRVFKCITKIPTFVISGPHTRRESAIVEIPQ
jgi:hypothetical protein